MKAGRFSLSYASGVHVAALPRLDEVAQALGAPKDPIAIWNAAFRQLKAPMADFLTRVAERLPVAEIRVKDDDDPKIEHRIKLKPGRMAGASELGLKFAMVATKVPGGAGLLVDEARRFALGQPRGPKARTRRSLDDSDGIAGGGHGLDRGVFDLPLRPVASLDSIAGIADRPLRAVASLDDLDVESMCLDFLPDEVWRQFGQPVAAGHVRAASSLDEEARTFIPIAIAVALIGLASTVLVAIVPIVLPMVMDAGKRFIESMKAGSDPLTAIGDAVDPESKTKRDAAAAAIVEGDDMKRKLMIGGGALAVVVVVGLLVYRASR